MEFSDVLRSIIQTVWDVFNINPAITWPTFLSFIVFLWTAASGPAARRTGQVIKGIMLGIATFIVAAAAIPFIQNLLAEINSIRVSF